MIRPIKRDHKLPKLIRSIFIVIDSAIFSVLLLIPLGILFRFTNRTGIMFVIGISVFLLTIMIRVKRMVSEKKQHEAEKERRNELDMLLLLSNDDLNALTGSRHFVLIRKEQPDRFDALEAIRQNADAIGLFTRSREISDLINDHNYSIRIYDAEELIGLISSDDKAKARTVKSTRLQFIRLNKYYILGGILFIASVFLHSKIYFRLTSSVCLIFALAMGVLQDRRMRNKIRIFLDKDANR